MTQKIPDDYDSPWKAALVRYFPEFLQFYFPLAYQAIDWQKSYKFWLYTCFREIQILKALNHLKGKSYSLGLNT